MAKVFTRFTLLWGLVLAPAEAVVEAAARVGVEVEVKVEFGFQLE